jgi:hypothetical protein
VIRALRIEWGRRCRIIANLEKRIYCEIKPSNFWKMAYLNTSISFRIKPYKAINKTSSKLVSELTASACSSASNAFTYLLIKTFDPTVQKNYNPTTISAYIPASPQTQTRTVKTFVKCVKSKLVLLSLYTESSTSRAASRHFVAGTQSNDALQCGS